MLGSTSRLAGGLSRLAMIPSRRLATSNVSRLNYSPVPKDLLKKMKMFQVDNGLPVHVKGGYFDKLLMAATYGICAIGLADCFHVYYVLAYPPQNKD